MTNGICNVFKQDVFRSNTPSNFDNPVEEARASAFSKSCLFASGAEVLEWEARCDEIVLTELVRCVKCRDVIVNWYMWKVLAENLLAIGVILYKLSRSKASQEVTCVSKPTYATE